MATKDIILLKIVQQNVTNTSGVAGTTHQTAGIDSGKLGGPRASDSSAGFGITAQQVSSK